jgi:hypothetical protein
LQDGLWKGRDPPDAQLRPDEATAEEGHPVCCWSNRRSPSGMTKKVVAQ